MSANHRLVRRRDRQGSARNGQGEQHDRRLNLELDPSERYNRAEEKPEIVARLAARLEEMSKETETSRAAP